MLTADGSPLVAGTPASLMATKHFKVTRPFYMNGCVQEVGKVIELDARFAAEMIAANRVISTEPPKAESVTIEPAPQVSRRKRNAE